MTTEPENIVIIGSGPAGYTAAIYAGRANLKPFVFSGFQAGGIPGGQLMTTTEVENFPGFPAGVTGPDLVQLMEQQARRWGAEMVHEDVIEVDFSKRPFTIKSDHRQLQAHAVIIATGATARRLGLPSEEKFWNAGISACAICDGATPIFRNEDLAIIGAGDTAAEEAIYLTKYASHVHLLVRSDKMRASKAMQDRLMGNDKITIHWHTEAVDVLGNDRMTGLIIRNNQNGKQEEINAHGLFYAIGHQPNTNIFKGKIDLDETGYIITKANSTATNLEGIFAAGDVQDHEFRQAITAAASGCMAAMLAERWLSSNNLAHEVHQETGKITTRQEEKMADQEFNPKSFKHQGSDALRELFASTDKLIVVKFGSPGCGPCRMLQPILDDLVEKFSGRFHLVEINIAEDTELAEAAGIMATPTVQFFKNQQQLFEIKGLKQKTEYLELIQKNL